MQRLVLAVCLLTPAVPAFASVSAMPDSQVIGACLDAVHDQARRQTPARDEDLYVLPTGPDAGGAWVPNTRSGGEAAWLGEAYMHLRSRQRQPRGWVPPEGISVSGAEVRVKALSTRRRWHEQPLHFLFWPPGYDASRTHALVLATFGPSDHGAEAACELELRNGRWEVVTSKAVSFL